MGTNHPDTPVDRNTEGISPLAVVTPGSEPTARSNNTPLTDTAIESLQRYTYDPYGNATSLAAMMLTGRTNQERLVLSTNVWPYSDNDPPNPISINKARKFLAQGYAALPCPIAEAGEHGHAWIIEESAAWLQRDGITSAVPVPTKPLKRSATDVVSLIMHEEVMTNYLTYSDLCQQGKARLITWFGEALFMDLHVDGLLPITVTPKQMLLHLEGTYSTTRDKRRHIERVEKDFNKPYDPNKPIEIYFKALQDTQAAFVLLGQPCADQQLINKALGEFDKQHEKEAHKAEKRWNQKTDTSWSAFKTFYKSELHEWGGRAPRARANHVQELEHTVATISDTVSVLQAEVRSAQLERDSLSHQLDYHRAMQAERRSTSHSGDDMSSITDHLLGMEARMSERLGNGTASATHERRAPNHSESDRARLLTNARERRPDAYRWMNQGKGRRFNKYCARCGVNCTHNTTGCLELKSDEKNRYATATAQNPMGGSTKFVERLGKYQNEFNFDSL